MEMIRLQQVGNIYFPEMEVVITQEGWTATPKYFNATPLGDPIKVHAVLLGDMLAYKEVA